MVVLLVHGVRVVELVSWSWYSANWGLGFEMEYWGSWGFVFVVVWSGFFDVIGITACRRCRVLSLFINFACYDLLMWGGRKGIHWWQSYGFMVFGRYLISFWLKIQLWFFKRMELLGTQLLFFPFECLGVLQITSNLNPLLRLGSGMWVTDFLPTLPKTIASTITVVDFSLLWWWDESRKKRITWCLFWETCFNAPRISKPLFVHTFELLIHVEFLLG